MSENQICQFCDDVFTRSTGKTKHLPRCKQLKDIIKQLEASNVERYSERVQEQINRYRKLANMQIVNTAKANIDNNNIPLTDEKIRYIN